MAVYENTVNYNNIIKSIGISELRCYSETGQSLFVLEAGAIGGVINKIKAFIKKVIEKIKALFHKFGAMIGQYSKSNKQFAKKYRTELLRKNLKDFEFNGWEFNKTSTTLKSIDLTTTADRLKNKIADLQGADRLTSDQLNELKETNRGTIVGGGKLDESDFRDKLKETLYGDDSKTDLTYGTDMPSMRAMLDFIENADKSDGGYKKAEKDQNQITKSLEAMIKKLDNVAKQLNNNKTTSVDTNEVADAISGDDKERLANELYNKSDETQAFLNDLTTAYGMQIQAIKDQITQYKAICVKALSYKADESAIYSESSVGEYDLFAGVTIK